ncbi:MAG TPA: hypothetical protein VHG92_13465, partial [Afifellaceae bacterium]|nr:hypothetical protein [Afifellaceae bacterium]
MTRPGCLLAPLAALFIAAAQPAQPQSDADRQSASVRAGSFHEDCMDLQEGETIDYAFSSSDALDFNVHYHVGSEIL